MTSNKDSYPNKNDEHASSASVPAGLIEELIKREAEAEKLESEINAYEKQIKQMENSKSWKRTSKGRKLVSNKTERETYIKELELRTALLETELLQMKEKFRESAFANQKLDYQSIWRIAQEKKQEGTLIDTLDKMIAAKQLRDLNNQQFLHATARLFMKKNTIYKKTVYEKILTGLKQEEIPEFMVRAALSDEQVSLSQAASFRGSLTARMRKLQLAGSLPEMVLDDKKLAYQFTEMLKIRFPKMDEKVYKLSEIEERDNIVIKPIDGAGARGVYLVYQNDDIIDVREAKAVPNFTVLRRNMERDLETRRVDQDAWLVEELITENNEIRIPARDVKFYCFYGKVGIVLEIIRYPELKYCWWTSDGARVSTGKYDYSSFEGKGITEDELKMAEEISKEIPAPFIRIDFLRGKDGLVFGEFTPKPGNYDEFDNPTDKWLGNFYLEAEARLEKDLIKGKSFHNFRQLLEKWDNNR